MIYQRLNWISSSHNLAHNNNKMAFFYSNESFYELDLDEIYASLRKALIITSNMTLSTLRNICDSIGDYNIYCQKFQGGEESITFYVILSNSRDEWTLCLKAERNQQVFYTETIHTYTDNLDKSLIPNVQALIDKVCPQE
jgi:hypothetical protein